MGWIYELSSLPPAMFFLYQGCSNSPNIANYWRQSIQILKSMENTSHSIYHNYFGFLKW